MVLVAQRLEQPIRLPAAALAAERSVEAVLRLVLAVVVRLERAAVDSAIRLVEAEGFLLAVRAVQPAALAFPVEELLAVDFLAPEDKSAPAAVAEHGDRRKGT